MDLTTKKSSREQFNVLLAQFEYGYVYPQKNIFRQILGINIKSSREQFNILLAQFEYGYVSPQKNILKDFLELTKKSKRAV